MRRRSPFVPLFSLALCVFAAWMYVSPYLAYRKLTRAADRGDVEALNDVVDFPALRTSFKDNVRSAVAREISADTDNPFAAMGGALAGMLTNRVVDAAVTPAGIAALTRGNDPMDGDSRGDGDRENTSVEREKRYEGLNRFAVRYMDRESGAEQFALILRRDGLGWKLTGVRFGRDVK
jgi:hypothetical protein